MSVTGWDGLVTLTVEIALSAATGTYGAWDTGIWDSSTWGPDVVWTDVSGYVRSAHTERGFSRALQVWQAGTATVVLDNQDGRFSPTNLSGPYVTSGITEVRPLRPIRIRATYSAVTYPIYQGYVQEWRESWSGGGPGLGDAVATVTCADEFGRLAAVDGMETSAQGGGELSGVRVHRVLDAAGHTGERAIESGENTLQETTLADATLAELESVVVAEGGALYVAADGALTFEGRLALIENSRSLTAQAVFGDDGVDISYVDAEVTYDSDLVVNYAAYTCVGGTVQAVADNTSRALYGDRRQVLTDLTCETDAQALALAQWAVQQYKDPESRFVSIVLMPRRNPAVMWPQALAREVRDLVTVNRNPPGGHEISRACHIAGVSHDIADSTQWTTTFKLWSAELYTQYALSRWDVGEWDEALWFF